MLVTMAQRRKPEPMSGPAYRSLWLWVGLALAPLVGFVYGHQVLLWTCETANDPSHSSPGLAALGAYVGGASLALVVIPVAVLLVWWATLRRLGGHRAVGYAGMLLLAALGWAVGSRLSDFMGEGLAC